MTTMAEACAARDIGMNQVEGAAGQSFADAARDFVLRYLGKWGGTEGLSCEDITDAAKEEGIVPHNDKAFGPVFARLSKDCKIERVGFMPRRKGHAAPGASIWRLA